MSINVRAGSLGEVEVWSYRQAMAMHQKLSLRALRSREGVDPRYLLYTDPHHPLLSRLESIAPGTYRHSIMAGSLAAVVAKKIGANPDLTRAIGYFHDIGKILNPNVFLESLSGTRGLKKPVTIEELNVILLHPVESRLLLEENGFPKEIYLAVEQHHGDMRTRIKIDNNNALLAYAGPVPDTIESALVMIADSAQATCARLRHKPEWQTKPSREFLGNIINNVIEELIEEDQLRNCPGIISMASQIRQFMMWWLFRYYNGLSTTETPLADELPVASPHMIRSNHRPK